MKPDEFLQPQAENIPAEAKARPQWVCWKAERRDGKLTKVPYNPQTHKHASVTNPQDWADFETALKQSTSNGYCGIGFVLTADDPFVALDLDHCWGRLGANRTAQPILQQIKSYTEISPSGKGLRVLAKGKLPPGGRKNGNVEMYDSGRYVTITGHVIPNGPVTVEDRQAEIEKIHKGVFGKKELGEHRQKKSSPPENTGIYESDLLQKAFASKNGDAIRRLYDGDIGGHLSHSEADLALCAHLAYWLKDADAIDAAFRQSGLMRDKWNRDDYRQRTIEKALEREAIQNEQENAWGADPQKNVGGGNKKTVKPKGVTLEELKRNFDYGKEIEFLWREHIPKKMPVMISGREGSGKTTNALQIAKEIIETTDAGYVVWLATEGAVIDTVDKMNVLGLDDPRFLIAQKSDGSFKFDFERHADRKELNTLLSGLDGPILAVFIDSIRGMSKFGDNDDAIGGVMHQVNAIVCDIYKAGLIYIDHHKKGKTDNKLDKVCGTTAKTSAVRIVYSIEKKSAVVCSIEPTKVNIFRQIPELKSIKMENRLIISQAEVVSDETMTAKAELFLTELFSKNSEMFARNVYDMGEKIGLTDGVIKKAKANLGCITVDKMPNNGPWIWKWEIA
jgi:hypothetical protein